MQELQSCSRDSDLSRDLQLGAFRGTQNPVLFIGSSGSHQFTTAQFQAQQHLLTTWASTSEPEKSFCIITLPTYLPSQVSTFPLLTHPPATGRAGPTITTTTIAHHPDGRCTVHQDWDQHPRRSSTVVGPPYGGAHSFRSPQQGNRCPEQAAVGHRGIISFRQPTTGTT